MADEQQEGSQIYLRLLEWQVYFDHRSTLTQWQCHLAKVTETMVCNSSTNPHSLAQSYTRQ